MTDPHTHFMQEALELARISLGQTWPNPSVGALIVKEEKIIARGHTQKGGRPHAETEALKQAGNSARGATLYVSLEPCAHHGKTPPCADAIIDAGISHCVIACGDINPRVNGKGIARLKEAGVKVTQGICEKEAQELNRGFFSLIEKKRPYVALKIATSQDGNIAYPPGEDKRWVTGENARQEVHRLRSEFDAVLTGIGTVLADDPLLTCRIEGLEHKSPVRVVLDRKLRISADSQLVKTANLVPLWVVHHTHPRECGDPWPHVKTLEISAQGGDDELPNVLRLLAEQGITRLLVEAGQALNSAFLASGMVDRLYWFKAPLEIKGGLPAFCDYEKAAKQLANWNKLGYAEFPPDILEILEPCSPAS